LPLPVSNYLKGKALTGIRQRNYAIDLTDHEEAEARRRWPGLYQHLLRSVKAARVAQAARAPTKDALDYVARWWQFGKPRPELRAALTG
ncbi:hypothetical protein, partial [Enterococcus faecium]